MRQLCLFLLFVAGFIATAQTVDNNKDTATPPIGDVIAEKKIELARQNLQRIADLVKAGALPRVRLEEAELDMTDVEDDAILARTLYGDLPIQNLSEKMGEDMVAAAQRRVERQQNRMMLAQKMVADGVTAASTLSPLQDELKMRELNLSLARSRAKLIGELASLARFEQSMEQVKAVTTLQYNDFVTPGMEHYEGSGTFNESRDLKPLEIAFAKKFDRALPISADGETAVHRSMGFDHRGRVDVALHPAAREGIWLKNYLKARGIPYYAFTRAIAGSATAAHIHIGPGSTRLHTSAD
ncbi:MAG TPA: hypothetical protein VKG25_20650 [Bryobacteraceae bacterium]|nr:hypothetical protein [Bryobacteraceae bacterium]